MSISKKKYTKAEMEEYAEHVFKQRVPEQWERGFLTESPNTGGTLIHMNPGEQEAMYNIANMFIDSYVYGDPEYTLLQQFQTLFKPDSKPSDELGEYYVREDGSFTTVLPGGKYTVLNKDTTMGELMDELGEDKAREVLLDLWLN